MTTQQAQHWLLENEYLIRNSTKMEPQKQREFFQAYNALNQIQKTQTSCGRCLHNMRVNLQDHIKQIKLMTKYLVYRTSKGNLSFKKMGDPVFTIRSNSKLMADEALKQLKDFEKRENKKVDHV